MKEETTMEPKVTIGFLPRERFELSAEALQSLYDHTPEPFELLVVDAATPEPYLREMQQVLDRYDNWRILRHDEHLLPAASKNLIVQEAGDDIDYLCLLENDNLFTDGWLSALIEACETFPAHVAAPVIREGRGEQGHFDRHLGSLVPSAEEAGRWEVLPLDAPRDSATETTRVDFVEQHCLLFRRSVFDRIGPYDEELNTRDEVDLSLALHHADATVVLEPRAIVNYVPPMSPPAADELPYYRMRWDLERAAQSRDRIRDRWSLVDTPGDLDFVRYRSLIPELPRVRSLLEGLSRPGRTVAVFDDGDWFDTEVTEGLDVIPFPDAGGHFAGFPADDDAALEEFDRLVATGLTDVVIGWPADWWWEYLPRLREALDSWATASERDGMVEILSRAP